MGSKATLFRVALGVVATALVGCLVYKLSRWLRSDDLFFWADELTVVSIGDGTTYWQLWHFLPDQLYGSRPLGFEFNKLLFDLFGMNYRGHVYGFLAVHLCNVLLVYLIFARLLGSRLYAYFGCVLYATYYPALATVFFIGAAFDLLSTTFMLLSLAAFLRGSRPALLLSLVAYYLSLRAKEAGIALPLFFSLYVWSQADFQWSWKALGTILRRCAGHYAILALFLAVYAHLARVNPLPAGDTYHLHFTDAAFLQGLVWYVNTMFFMGEKATLCTLFFLAVLAASLFLRWKPGILGGIGFILALQPVIFVPEHHHPGYLYGPLAFFVLIPAGLAQAVGGFLQQRLRAPAAAVAVLAVGVCLFCGWKATRSDVARAEIHFAIYARRPMARIYRLVHQEVPQAEPGAVFYITGLPPDLMPAYKFYTEGAKLFRLVYHDPGIECFMESNEGALRAKYDRQTRPRYFIDYHDGAPTLLHAAASGPSPSQAAAAPRRL